MSPEIVIAPAPAHPCDQHAGNETVAWCRVCQRAICHVCVFTIGSATFCPTCVTAGPTERERFAAAVKTWLSLLLAALGLALTGVFFFNLAPAGTHGFLSYPWIGASMGGASLALVARDAARRHRSILPTVALAANVALILVQITSTVIGLLGGE